MLTGMAGRTGRERWCTAGVLPARANTAAVSGSCVVGYVCNNLCATICGQQSVCNNLCATFVCLDKLSFWTTHFFDHLFVSFLTTLQLLASCDFFFTGGGGGGGGGRYCTGPRRYTGTFVHGDLHGHGSLVFCDGRQYDGGT